MHVVDYVTLTESGNSNQQQLHLKNNTFYLTNKNIILTDLNKLIVLDNNIESLTRKSVIFMNLGEIEVVTKGSLRPPKLRC